MGISSVHTWWWFPCWVSRPPSGRWISCPAPYGEQQPIPSSSKHIITMVTLLIWQLNTACISKDTVYMLYSVALSFPLWRIWKNALQHIPVNVLKAEGLFTQKIKLLHYRHRAAGHWYNVSNFEGYGDGGVTIYFMHKLSDTTNILVRKLKRHRFQMSSKRIQCNVHT